MDQLTYGDFASAYLSIFNRLESYKAGQAGRGVYLSKLLNLVKQYPDYALRFENDPKYTF